MVWPVHLILLHLPKLCPARSEERPGPAAGRSLLRQMEQLVVFIRLFLLQRAGLTWTDWQDKGSSCARAMFPPAALHCLCCPLSLPGTATLGGQPWLKSTGFSTPRLSKGFCFFKGESKKFY